MENKDEVQKLRNAVKEVKKAFSQMTFSPIGGWESIRHVKEVIDEALKPEFEPVKGRLYYFWDFSEGFEVYGKFIGYDGSLYGVKTPGNNISYVINCRELTDEEKGVSK